MPVDAAVQETLRACLLEQGTPPELVEHVIEATNTLVDEYVAGRMRSAEMGASDFVESMVRVLEWLTSQSHTPLNRPISRMDRFVTGMESASLDDSLRIHVPRLLQFMYDIRNRRGVGHLPGAISANAADAEVLLVAAQWILCELVRIYHTGSIVEAQALIDSMVKAPGHLVEDFEDVKRVTAGRQISLPTKLLLLIYASEPHKPTVGELTLWSRAERGRVREALRRLDDRDLLHLYNDGRAELTRPGRDEAHEVTRSLTRRGHT